MRVDDPFYVLSPDAKRRQPGKLDLPIGIFILGMRGRRRETARDGVESKVVSDDQGGEAENRRAAIM